MKTYEGLVQIDNRLLRVQVTANDPTSAKQMLEAQYPNGKLQGLPLEKIWLHVTWKRNYPTICA